MRMTIDLPDELFRRLATRAAMLSMSACELVESLVEAEIESRSAPTLTGNRDRRQLPVIVSPTGKVITTMSSAALGEIEDSNSLLNPSEAPEAHSTS